MKLLKPSWVSHNGKPIFSVDIHPDGTKFATGGQGEDSGKVMIWNMAPVLREEDEKNENVPKMLCQMDNHLACVNCVRWSNNGLYLASGGDDKLVMVWKRAAFIGPSTVFGSSSKLANVEQWRCVTILRNHTGDVMDVAWSPHDVWLASCSVDNTIVVWNARKFPEMVTCLRGHTGLVKGLTWDPVGKYIASQADDHSLKVWRTVDWQMEANITKPFSECGGTTHVLRLSWSPDGQYLVSAHAMNNSGPTAQIVERDGWKTNMDFVGHRKAVTVVKFNPKIFKKKQKNGSSPKPSCPYCCCAVGSKDRSLSVWLTSLKRPLVVIHDLFDKSIMDISWTLTGLGMLVCSMDGTIAYLDFSLDELGDPLSEDEKNTIHQNIYGKSLAITSTQETQLATTIIENPEMLKYQQERQSSAQNNSGAAGADSLAPKLNSVMNGESLEDIRKNLLKKQVETRTADGRRRITPLCIAQLDTGDFSPALFNSVPILPSSLSNQLPPQLSTDSSSGQVVATVAAPSLGGQRPNLDPVLALPPPTNTAPKGLEDPKDQVLPSGVKASMLLASASKMEPMKALDSRFTERSKTTPGVPAAISSTTGLLPLDRPKDVVASVLKDVKAKEDTSSDSEDKMAVINKNLSLCKRKPEPLMLDAAEVVEKRKKGRPRKDKMAPPILSQSFAQSLQVLSPPEREPMRAASVVAAAPTPTPAAVLRLPTPSFQKTFSMQVSTDPAVFLEVENEVTSAAGSRLSQLRCSRDGREWNTLLPSSVVAAAGSGDVVAVACQDRMLSVFSSCGRRLLPSIQLNSPVSTLDCSARFVMTLTAGATLSVWDVHKQRALVKNESLAAILSGSEVTVSQSLLTEQGVPVVGLSNGKSFCFSSSLETWTLIADRGDCLVQCADFRSCLSTQDAPGSSGPLATMQGRNLNGGRLASRLSAAPHHLQQSMTMAFLENQLAAALTLQSTPEYRYWLLIYTRFLVNEGSEFRLRELCKELLGPAHKSTTTAWEATTLEKNVIMEDPKCSILCVNVTLQVPPVMLNEGTNAIENARLEREKK
ncbi:protein HIRA isoform X2 [Corythoichthys intestinalis]|uniref:protein HIRA isoform X2 n=1 Tax=Corythoichthys intestinalis TaxID=161448 RepID=UPI0025A539DA|nr:protein HIRA isoform X2 [Corythoichthys intestinalis]